MILMAKPNMLGKERKYMCEAFDSNWIAPLGEFVERFEEDVKKFVGAKRAVATSSGTSALHLAMLACGVGKGDVVLCPDTTFVASINPALYCGAKPVFVDIDYKTLNVNKELLYKAIKEYHPKAFVMLHMYGVPCADAEEIVRICHENDVRVIEDATEALGSKIGDKFCGTFGDVGCFSFNGNKIITTSGGGMVVTDDDSIADKVFYLATQAKEKTPYYFHEEIGYNYRMSNICAAIGVGQMEYLPVFVVGKNRIHDEYAKHFETITCSDDSASNYWLSVIKVSNPSEFVEKMRDAGIETRRIWTPLHSMPYLSEYDVVCGGDDTAWSANSVKAFESYVCMPSDPMLSRSELDYVIGEAKKYV